MKFLPTVSGGQNLTILPAILCGDKKLLKFSQFSGIIEKLVEISRFLGVH